MRYLLASSLNNNELAHQFFGYTTPSGIILKLVAADTSNGEITSLGMGDHKAADAAVRLHSTTLGEPDADVGEMQDVI